MATLVSVLLIAAIIAPSCAVHQPYRQSFAPQTQISVPITIDVGVTITAVAPHPTIDAITDTDCATDFADVLPTDNRFDDRPIADWGDNDDGCDPFPQNERPSVF